MSIQITDNRANIKVVEGKEITLIPKIGIALSTYKTGIWLKVIGGEATRIEVSDVTVPVVVTPLQLEEAIDAMIENSPLLSVNPIMAGVGQLPNDIIVTNSSTTILSAIISPLIRTACIMTNLGSKLIWITIGQTAVDEKGFQLDKNGGEILLDAAFINNQVINGITKTGTSKVTFQEFIL